MTSIPDSLPAPQLHDWHIEAREYARQEARRGRRHAFESLSPQRTALVVIDMLPFFVTQNGYCAGIVPNILHLADSLRRRGGTVAWIVPAAVHAHPALAEEFYGAEAAELFRTSGGEGPLPGRIWPDLHPQSQDLFHEKTGYSAFRPGDCGLAGQLRRLEIDTVLIAGTVSNVCCESSARDAFAEGFRVVFVADANAARRDADHNAALHTIYRSFGDVRPTAEVVGLLGA